MELQQKKLAQQKFLKQKFLKQKFLKQTFLKQKLVQPETVRLLMRLALAISAVVIVLLSLAFGAVAVSFNDLLTLLTARADPQTHMIVWELRLPRTLLALCVGAMLATSGAVAQGLFRNPLADPSLIGVAAGASAGASLVIVFMGAADWPAFGLSMVSAGAFLGGVGAVLLIYRIASSSAGISVSAMLLTGIAISFMASSLSGFLEFIADNEMLRQMTLWRMGGLDSAGYSHVSIALFVCLAMLLSLPGHYNALNALLLGESEARHLGIDVQQVKLFLTFWIALAVGTSVALAGMISFVGLIVPHVVRMIVGPNHYYLVPFSALAGGILLTLSDTLARTLLAPTELPVGLITAIIGAPVFISMLTKRHRYGMQ